MLTGRLSIDFARAPHADRHGVLYVEHSRLAVDDGCITIETAGFDGLASGSYAVPFQTVSALLMGPGCSCSHDVLRVGAAQGLMILAVGQDGVRLYSFPPIGADSSDLARAQTRLWADPDTRRDVARRLYAWKLSEILPSADLNVLRGIEGARAKESYRLLAQSHGITWHGRKFDREQPTNTDLPNQAINHAATCVYAAAGIAVAMTRCIPQLGFIHEESGDAFVLDIADLYRDEITLPIAFSACKKSEASGLSIDRQVRMQAAALFKKRKLIGAMIDRIKNLLEK